MGELSSNINKVKQLGGVKGHSQVGGVVMREHVFLWNI